MAATPKGFSLVTSNVSSDKPMQVKYFWPKYIPASGAILVDGDSGVGKSRFTASWLRYADGVGELPDGSPSTVAVKSIIYITGEMDDDQTRDVFVRQGWEDWELDKRLRRVYDVSGPNGELYPFSLDSTNHLQALEALCKDFDANVVVMDPFIEFFLGDENNTHTARAYVRKVQDMGKRLGILFILIHHWNKNEELSGRNRVSGSHQLTATVRARLSLFKQKDNSDRKIVKLEKAIEESMPDIGYEIDEYGQVDWIHDLKPQRSLANLVDWLRLYLGDKVPHPMPEVRADAFIQGYTKDQVKRAIERIRDEIDTTWVQLGPAKREAWRLK